MLISYVKLSPAFSFQDSFAFSMFAEDFSHRRVKNNSRIIRIRRSVGELLFPIQNIRRSSQNSNCNFFLHIHLAFGSRNSMFVFG